MVEVLVPRAGAVGRIESIQGYGRAVADTGATGVNEILGDDGISVSSPTGPTATVSGLSLLARDGSNGPMFAPIVWNDGTQDQFEIGYVMAGGFIQVRSLTPGNRFQVLNVGSVEAIRSGGTGQILLQNFSNLQINGTGTGTVAQFNSWDDLQLIGVGPTSTFNASSRGTHNFSGTGTGDFLAGGHVNFNAVGTLAGALNLHSYSTAHIGAQGSLVLDANSDSYTWPTTNVDGVLRNVGGTMQWDSAVTGVTPGVKAFSGALISTSFVPWAGANLGQGNLYLVSVLPETTSAPLQRMACIVGNSSQAGAVGMAIYNSAGLLIANTTFFTVTTPAGGVQTFPFINGAGIQLQALQQYFFAFYSNENGLSVMSATGVTGQPAAVRLGFLFPNSGGFPADVSPNFGNQVAQRPWLVAGV